MARLGHSWKEAGGDTSTAGIARDDKTLLEMAVGALTSLGHRTAPPKGIDPKWFDPQSYTEAQLIEMGRNARTVNTWIGTKTISRIYRAADDMMVYYVGGELICVEDAALPCPSDLTVAKLG